MFAGMSGQFEAECLAFSAGLVDVGIVEVDSGRDAKTVRNSVSDLPGCRLAEFVRQARARSFQKRGKLIHNPSSFQRQACLRNAEVAQVCRRPFHRIRMDLSQELSQA